MANVIKLRKGLDINLKGKAARKRDNVKPAGEYALVPADFIGVVPKVVVREGDVVKAGDALFVNKKFPEVGFASPVSGTITEVVRGERRKLLCVKVKADSKQEYRKFDVKDPASLDGKAVVAALLDAGLFGYINQLPYAVSATPDADPKAIFVSAFRDMPLTGDVDVELEGNEKAFQAGLTALSRIAKTYLGICPSQASGALGAMKDVETNIFDGPCPAGNVGVQVNHLDPVNKGEVVWTVDPASVIFIGRLFLDGKVDLRRTVALAGSEMSDPCYVDVCVGYPFRPLVEQRIDAGKHVRLINGNPLTGTLATLDGYVGGHTSEITAIPEGDDCDEMLGWIMPRTKEFSANRSYFSWLFGKGREYTLDARVKGGERHMIMSGEYDSVIPMDIFPEYLVKAIIAGNIDKMEQLGIYEVAPEDFALAEFVDSSKLELQRIVREGLDMLRKENA
ncbi:MAG: Na(+)-translocating NADH-quinone reductase subunit A [Prevotella sp.]|nr:Na(+)-translocating NADH-quinone reductase subunit A [Prevotella sp.]